MPAPFPPGVLVVMGVSGSGKTTVARGLALRLGWAFEEGDALHPAANVAKMHAGHPLDDADRGPWLDRIAGWIDAQRTAGQPGVVTCSALKRAYRERIIGARPDVRLIYLHAPRAVLAERIGNRHDHFMPASLLDSQLATLEEPGEDERPIRADVSGPTESVVEQIVHALATSPLPGSFS